ncbi:hypothetical protein WG66_008178 [Moniliophthora roreri]|uniref:Uncharacterized protein n=1 Tax=Moniliophthora roreri TaxID=221103 RepID=A0A0W0G6E0_MONRR|nr:hypothetical protein WG66_008178 [Moniliophthora roreri]
MSSTIPEDLVDFVTIGQVVVLPITTLSVAYFVYGFYALLFGTCIYMMRRRQATERDGEELNHRFYLLLTVILFTLSTMWIGIYTAAMVLDSVSIFTGVITGDYESLDNYLTGNTGKTILVAGQHLILVLLRYFPFIYPHPRKTQAQYSSTTADYMLVHRCYVIWGFRKRIGVPLIVASVLINTLGLIAVIILTIGVTKTSDDSNWALFGVGGILIIAYIIGSTIFNSVLTLLTAGRIWWIHRQVEAHAVHCSGFAIRTISRIILESGIIYPAVQVASLVLVNVSPKTPYDFSAVSVMAAGIAPTLIIVRAKLGQSVESLQEQASEIQFASRPARPGKDFHHTNRDSLDWESEVAASGKWQ